MALRKILTPQFVSVFLSQFALSFTANLLIPTLPIYLASLGSREETIGVLIGALSASSVILRPAVGRALNRVPERKFLLAGALIYIVTSIGYIVAPPFWPFFMMRILQGIGAAFFYTASVVMVINISPEAHRAESISYFYTAYNFASAIAPSVGMVMINLVNFPSLFLLCAALSLLSLILALRLPKKSVQPPGSESTQNRPFFDLKTLHPAVMCLFSPHPLGSVGCFFPSLCCEPGGCEPWIFLWSMCPNTHRGSDVWWKDFGSLQQGESHSALSHSIHRVHDPPLILENPPLFILVAVIYGAGIAFFFPTMVVYTVERAGCSPRTCDGNLYRGG